MNTPNNRFQIKFNNGVWKLFDRHNFKDKAVFGLRAQAAKALAEVSK